MTLRPTLIVDGALCASSTGALVFSSERGGPMRHNLFYARQFKAAVRAAAELESLTALNERVMRHLAEQPLAEASAPDER